MLHDRIHALVQYEVTPMTMTGWTCPKCGAVYAPVVVECHRCNAATLTVHETGATDDRKPYEIPLPYQEKVRAKDNGWEDRDL